MPCAYWRLARLGSKEGLRLIEFAHARPARSQGILADVTMPICMNST